jgi:asparagine synthetase B (glutamine-hydrolysing)
MCGIAGILLSGPGPIGESLVQMCAAMRHRGIDSTGFALYGEPDPDRLIVRLRFPDARGRRRRLMETISPRAATSRSTPPSIATSTRRTASSGSPFASAARSEPVRIEAVGA